MKKLFFLISCLVAVATLSFAQEDQPMMHEHEHPNWGYSEVILGHGFLPSDQIFSGGGMSHYQYNNDVYTGAIFATYRFHVSKLISLGMTIAYENEQGTFNDNNYYPHYYPNPYPYPYNYNSGGSFRRNSFTFAPEITFNYGDFGHDLVRLYSVVGMGYTFRNEVVKYANDNTEYVSPYARPVHFNGYISPLGIRFGRQLSGFFEVGLGYKGVFNYGATYRF
jgi:hypothetical protein